jgi:hypothetical protein
MDAGDVRLRLRRPDGQVALGFYPKRERLQRLLQEEEVRGRGLRAGRHWQEHVVSDRPILQVFVMEQRRE